jgi:hypothetical protein
MASKAMLSLASKVMKGDKSSIAKSLATITVAGGLAAIAGKAFSTSEPLEGAESIHLFPPIRDQIEKIRVERAVNEKAYCDLRDSMDRFLTLLLATDGSEDATAEDVTMLIKYLMDFEKYTLWMVGSFRKPDKAVKVFDAYEKVFGICSDLVVGVMVQLRESANISWKVRSLELESQ